MKILVINGPNINMIGIREKELYGSENYASVCKKIKSFSDENGLEVEIFQSNHEGAIVDQIQNCFGKADGIVINPGAYTHTSIAIADALRAVSIPTVEVHITDIYKREDYRKINYIRDCCDKSVIGMGTDGYIEALRYFVK